MKKKVRISQCLIVRNEEKNIQKALSWGKDVLSEQIVVDTGSTDRTVELAEAMGARVFFFDWIDDFSAAKNFAIEQARGDYIAFLDADEYFTEEDAKKLYQILTVLENQKELKHRDLIIQSNLYNLDDNGKIFTTTVQSRIFSNSGTLRYINRIHEILHSTGAKPEIVLDMTTRLTVYHTGYSDQAYRETRKLERNISLLKRELERNKDDFNNWTYLGESLMVDGKLDEAENAFWQVVSNSQKEMMLERRVMAYVGLIKIIVIKNRPEAEEQLKELYEKARSLEIHSPDLEYLYGYWMYDHEKPEEAICHLEKGLMLLENYDKRLCIKMTSELNIVYGILTHTNYQLGNKTAAVRYATLTLRRNRFMDAALETLLLLFKQEPGQSTDPADTLHFLEKLYLFSELKDKLYLMKAAKKVGFDSLYEMIFELLSEKEQSWLNGRNKSPYRLEKAQAEEKYPDIPYNNETDADFLALLEEIRSRSAEELLEQLLEKLEKLRTEHPDYYNQFIDFFVQYPFWGKLEPEENRYDVLESRIKVLKENTDSFIWLYSHLEDYRSRKCLVAVMDNWLRLNLTGLLSVKESGLPYFDLDLIQTGRDEVFVDAGAFVGDSTLDFIKTYGEDYRRIYCYEITPDNMDRLKKDTKVYQNIVTVQKAVYSHMDTLYLSYQNDTSMNQAVAEGTIKVQAASLDEDIEERVSFIKINVEGLERKALEGCKEHIRKEHPRLAVSAYHNYEDLFKIPVLIAETDPSYRFYLRYYGGNMIPMKFIVYAV